jgi:hypothetical protein
MLPLFKNKFWAKQFLNVHNQLSSEIIDLESSLPLFPGNNKTAPGLRNPSDSSISRIHPDGLADACLTI